MPKLPTRISGPRLADIISLEKIRERLRLSRAPVEPPTEDYNSFDYRLKYCLSPLPPGGADSLQVIKNNFFNIFKESFIIKDYINIFKTINILSDFVRLNPEKFIREFPLIISDVCFPKFQFAYGVFEGFPIRVEDVPDVSSESILTASYSKKDYPKEYKWETKQTGRSVCRGEIDEPTLKRAEMVYESISKQNAETLKVNGKYHALKLKSAQQRHVATIVFIKNEATSAKEDNMFELFLKEAADLLHAAQTAITNKVASKSAQTAITNKENATHLDLENTALPKNQETTAPVDLVDDILSIPLVKRILDIPNVITERTFDYAEAAAKKIYKKGKAAEEKAKDLAGRILNLIR